MKQITLYKSWLDLDKYQFKVLVMIAALAQEKRGFRGKLKDMCDFLHTTHRENIKKAIYELQDKGLINASLDGYTWTISLTEIAEDSDENSITIDLDNFTAIQNYKAADPQNYVAWENILKVFIFLIFTHEDILTYKIIATQLNLSIDVVRRCIVALDTIQFSGMIFFRKKVWKKSPVYNSKFPEFRVIGQRITLGWHWGT